MKGFSITLLIVTFFAFLFYQNQKSSDFKVLKITSPTEIVADLNKNGVQDNDETIVLQNVQSFSTKPSGAQAALALQIKITDEDALGLGFLAENFAKSTLLDKNVKLKHNIIIIDNKNYENLLHERGFALFKGKAPSKLSPELAKNLEKVHKLNLRIFNNKSHKYHKLNCKYGLIAHNSQILPAFQLPKDAKPCKFCFAKKQIANSKKQTVKFDDKIPYVASPATVYQTNSIKIFLTDFTRVLKPNNRCETPVCKTLVEQINSAQNTIDFAIYGYSKIPALENALTNAQKRGVKVRFVYDSDENKANIYPDTLYLAKLLTNNNTDYAPAIMHDKFFIFDGKTLLTGSANISNTDMSGFNSNVVILANSEKLAGFYSQEFEQMYNGNFHKTKSKIKDKTDGDLEVYFSPKDKGISAVLPLIDNSQKYIYIPAFLITRKDLAQSLINAHNRGVSVKVILDATNTHTSSSKMKLLRQSGIQVKTENFAGKLHSKSVIIDDLYTIIGSMNFSRSGETANDENLLIIKNPEIAQFYKTFFQYLWKRIPDKWLKLNARSESPDSIGSCSDGIDNDFDGKIDMKDDSCQHVLKN